MNRPVYAFAGVCRRSSAALLFLICGCPEPGPVTPPADKGAKTAAAAVMKFSKNGHRLISEGLYVAQPAGGTVTPQREPSIDQDKLLQGGYTLAQVLEAGQNQFNVPFDPANGWGEGANGPRSKQRAIWNPRGGTGQYTAWPFLRVDGIDSQSCFECHSSIGVYTPPGSQTTAMVRKPGAQGGPAGAANTAFINDQFPEELSQLTEIGPDGKPIAVMTKFARNPPVVFGTGYTQQLAMEMTTDLQSQQAAATAVAQKNPGKLQSIDLVSKGQTFGTLSVTCTSADASSCTVDTSKVTGVQPDLVVRPFQWGGIASSVRHFARDALDFHFSVQAVEKVGDLDCDGDGLKDEITVGNVTALTSYVTMYRPPQQIIPKGQEEQVGRGQQLVSDIGCTSCHSDKMVMQSPWLTVQTPPAAPTTCPQEVSTLGNSASADELLGLSRVHVTAASATPAVTAALADASATPTSVFAAMQASLVDPTRVAAGNYQIDLNLTGVKKGDVPAYVWPRLSAGSDGTTPVPLFSDLRLHFMGKALSDDYAQGTDNPEYAAQPGYYVTRVLWGVGDTAPYMHDGRARTLDEAIALHGADGSEAQPIYQKFAALSAEDQAAIIAFLSSQRLTVSQGISETEYVQK